MKFFATLLAIVAIAAAQANAATIADIATSTPDLSILVQAVTAANLTEALQDPVPRFTVFAPTNEAFQSLLSMLGVSASELLADTDTLASVLKYHVVPFEVTAADLSDGEVPTLLGAPLTVKKNDTGVYITPTGGPTAKVVTADIKADNGVVHVIDAVLLPGASSTASPAAEEYTMVEAAPSSE